MATVSARDFNHDVSAAKRAAARAPLIITDRGKPSFVLLSIEEFRRLSRAGESIVDLLRMDHADIEFEPERIETALRIPEL
ncbi:MAG: type II toxin-antitoxin system Phd/YefM family antitoxin [Microbacteriaceae bacterium]|nr:MAG: type II toxin-antitoxin system Phd/YefM family antitoxin [Microbacteriaceae bacterium]